MPLFRHRLNGSSRRCSTLRIIGLCSIEFYPPSVISDFASASEQQEMAERRNSISVPATRGGPASNFPEPFFGKKQPFPRGKKRPTKRPTFCPTPKDH